MTRLAVLCMLLSGCFKPRLALPEAPAVQQSPVSILDSWGVWSTYAGGGLIVAAALSIVAFGFLRVPPPKWSGFLGVCGLALIISGQLFVWLEKSLWYLSIGTLAVGLLVAAALLWKHRNAIEQALDVDLDRNGKVGA
jgi:hypothetical protein